MKLSPTEIYKDRKIFLIGSTGFLGKVTLSMLLHRFPNVGKVYVTVRARSQEESEVRFWNNIITAPPFDPLRDRYGNALEGFIRDKVVVRGGDIGETNLGYTEEEARQSPTISTSSLTPRATSHSIQLLKAASAQTSSVHKTW